MENKPTYELDELLKSMKPEQLDEYYKKNTKYLADAEKSFYYYFKDVVDSKNIQLKDVYLMANVSESYGSKLVTMEKHTKNRDMIIRLCVAGHFHIDEINRALKLYGMSPLYSKDKRDACIIVSINNRTYDLYKINELLESKGLKQLIITE